MAQHDIWCPAIFDRSCAMFEIYWVLDLDMEQKHIGWLVADKTLSNLWALYGYQFLMSEMQDFIRLWHRYRHFSRKIQLTEFWKGNNLSKMRQPFNGWGFINWNKTKPTHLSKSLAGNAKEKDADKEKKQRETLISADHEHSEITVL